jgi:hypothetical protein
MTAKKTEITLQDCLAGAFQALLRGDTAERDRLCALAERAFQSSTQDALPADSVVTIEKDKLI